METTIKLSGRLDTAHAPAIESAIDQQIKAQRVQPEEKVIIDCSDLQYISSTGLRILLKYKKLYTDFEVINVSDEVYGVFDVTGFSRIMTVRKALRKVSIAGCQEIARGGVGIIYRYDDDTIIKVFPAACGIEIPERERIMARESFILGMPTAIPFDLVWVTDTQSYGLMTEMINAKTLGATINENRENYQYYADLFGKLLHEMHQIKVQEGILPDTVKVHQDDFRKIAPHFLPEQIELMNVLISRIPRGKALLHNDCHPKNIMVRGERGNEELLLIDMGEVSYGNPLFDLLHVSSTFHMGKGFDAIVGFPEELSGPFWRETLKSYFNTQDEQIIDEYAEIIDAAGIVRAISWIALASFPQEVIDGVRKIADEKLWKNKDYYLAMSERFKDLPFD